MNSFKLKIQKFGALFLVDIDIWDLKEQAYRIASLVIDTGASVTTISKNVLLNLGYDTSNASSVRVTTVSRTEYFEKINIAKIKLGNFELENIEVHAHDFPHENYFYGLLGLNVLTRFDVNFLFSQNLLELTPRNNILK